MTLNARFTRNLQVLAGDGLVFVNGCGATPTPVIQKDPIPNPWIKPGGLPC